MLTICTQYLKYINRETYRSFKKKFKKVISGPAIKRPSKSKDQKSDITSTTNPLSFIS